MRKFDSFTNKYSISKTLKFRLIPIGNTLKYINEKGLLNKDIDRADNYRVVKNCIDKYHKQFIEKYLSNISLMNLENYAECYYSSKEGRKELLACYNQEYYKLFKNVLGKNQEIKNEFETLFSKDIIKKLVDGSICSDEEKDKVTSFSSFYTYFTGYNENRKNIYSYSGNSTEIAYRVIEQNLPKFLDNAKQKDKIISILDIESLNRDFVNILEGYSVINIFDINFYNVSITQKGIDRYNTIIGGYSLEDGKKIKGINEYINEYNQQALKKIPLLKPLYKQILSDKTQFSFLSKQFTSDEELIGSLYDFWNRENGCEIITNVCSLLNNINNFDLDKIFVDYVYIPNISMALFKDWSFINRMLKNEYDAKNSIGKMSFEKYSEKRDGFLKKQNYSLASLDKILVKEDSYILGNIYAYFGEEASKILKKIQLSYKGFLEIKLQYNQNCKLCNDESSMGKIKTFLDSLKDFQWLLDGIVETDICDSNFYAELLSAKMFLDIITPLYNKCRNYLTKKPYSDEKIKLNFDNVTLLNGWDKNKEEDNTSIILRKGGKYYLGIIDALHRRCLRNVNNDDEEFYEKMIYKQIPDAAKFLSSKQINPQNPPDEIKRILEKKSMKEEPLNEHEIECFIDYCINDFLKTYRCIIDEEGNNYFDFHFKKPSEYKTINEFFMDVNKQAYSVKFKKLSKKAIDSLVENGELYLFQIYNKDFSEFSKGKKNLHTMYFEALFSEYNLKNNIYALNGGGEVFYREASLPNNVVTHAKNVPIKNKNYQYKNGNNNEYSVFEYDLVKDKRYRENEFFLHFPITINQNAPDAKRANINNDVIHSIMECDKNYVIGIDRGERNLLYISVIDEKGQIIEQFSTNVLSTGKNDDIELDYHAMLMDKEKERQDSRRSWNTIDSIKNLKTGYISSVVKKICDLAIKYDAVIAIEDLNFGFINTRSKFERQVYQQFEKALIDKLNYFVFKSADNDETGSVYHGYQLAKPYVVGDRGKQSGIIFYVPAWNTSKIDPTTGFVNLFNLKYESIEKTKMFFSKFDKIIFNKSENTFDFMFDYSNFDGGLTSYRKKWVVSSYGERIVTSRNDMGIFTYSIVNITQYIIKLLETYNIDYKLTSLKDVICQQNDKDFFVKFIRAFNLILQMRNSIPNSDEDYLLSPVKNSSGYFFDSRNADCSLPKNADANGAYNIARKGLMIINRIKEGNLNSIIKNEDWLAFAQYD